MSSWWARWLVLGPVLLFIAGATMLSCGGNSGGSSSSTPSPGFALQNIVVANGPPPSATPTPSPTATKATMTPTVTPRPSAVTTCVPTTAPSSTPTPVQFNAIGTFVKRKTLLFFEDLTMSPTTIWTTTNPNILQPPAPGANGGTYFPGVAGCVCIAASNSNITSQLVTVGVGVDDCVANCPQCNPTPTASATPPAGMATPASASTATASRSAGVLMWTYEAGTPLRGRIAVGGDGSIYFITRDQMLHGVDATGKEFLRRTAYGSSPAVASDGTAIAMVSDTELGSMGPDGAILWHVEIGASDGPLAAGSGVVYAASGNDLVSVNSASGALNWRVAVGGAASAAITSDGIVVGATHGAVTALALDGGTIWTFQPDGGFSGAVAYADDVVYAGSMRGGVYALDARTGSQLWHTTVADAVSTGPIITPSGAIFAGAGAVYGLYNDGQVRFKDSALQPDTGGIVALGNDSILDAATGDVGAVLMGDGGYAWATRGFGKITTAAASSSGVAYIANTNGRIFAVR